MLWKDFVRLGFLLVLFTCSHTGLSQERQVLKGTISADSLNGVQINIVNLTAETGTVSNTDGSFQILAKTGDTLLFSSVKYRPYHLLVTDSVLREDTLEIALKIAVTILPTVYVSGTGLSGNLSKDVDKVYVFDQAAVGFPISGRTMTPIERRLYYLRSTRGVEALYYAITGKAKRLAHLREQMIKDAKIDAAINLVSRRFFVDRLGLPEDHIQKFVAYCQGFEPFLSLVSEERVLGLMEFFREKAVPYKEIWQL